MVSRAETIQALLDFYPAPTYLEVGVQDGVTFHAVKAATKVAVDPFFRFPVKNRDPAASYFETTSDAYFSTLNRRSPKFNVIFLDGLHTFEQTLRDLLTAIDYLQSDGVIVIDDVIPSSYHASLPSIPEFERIWPVASKDGSVDWMGDVYRMVFFIETFLPAYNYATIADNHGQLVMWRGKRGSALKEERTVEAVSRLEYKDTILFSEEFNKMNFEDVILSFKKDLFEECENDMTLAL